MGCCASADALPDVILPDPAGESEFIVEAAGSFTKHFVVLNKQREKWLFLRKDNGSFWDPSCSVQLENYVRAEGAEQGEVLGSVFIEGNEPDFKMEREIEKDDDDEQNKYFWWEEDSDDGEEETEYKAKMKWTLNKKAVFKSKLGAVSAELKVVMAGKSKAEVEITDKEDGTQEKKTKTKSKVKKIFYTLTHNGEEIPITYDNKDWEAGDRTWATSAFKAFYDEKSGRDTLEVSTTTVLHPCEALLMGYVLGFFMHPKFLVEKMEGFAERAANQMAFHHE
eukprot:TRINITY_DN1909_c0_g1_i2.p1 TRINITY_DN1909_c0_g1~~TRINITY_DN1909_c0_g1_i2.p1  ORF type:complete len:301 (+),score=102.38 TRINITY_DN1909_c0_g1_i2:66-905(+)